MKYILINDIKRFFLKYKFYIVIYIFLILIVFLNNKISKYYFVENNLGFIFSYNNGLLNNLLFIVNILISILITYFTLIESTSYNFSNVILRMNIIKWFNSKVSVIIFLHCFVIFIRFVLYEIIFHNILLLDLIKYYIVYCIFLLSISNICSMICLLNKSKYLFMIMNLLFLAMIFIFFGFNYTAIYANLIWYIILFVGAYIINLFIIKSKKTLEREWGEL